MAEKKKRQPPGNIEVFYHVHDREYWFMVSGRYLSLKKSELFMHLRTLGLLQQEWHPADVGNLNELDWVLWNAQRRRGIDYAGALAGHKKGIFKDGSGRMFLVTDQAAGVWDDVPKRGPEPKFFRAFIEELLPDDQWQHFCYWLPDVSGKLFLTFTLDPKLYANEETAFEDSRQWLRKVFFQLRRGVGHEGKIYVIDAPYCIKVEFHESGWVHYHAIFLTRRFLPKELLAELWGLGWVKVQRITNQDFHYLLKYVTKPDELPDWVKKRKRLRVFQTTKGFLKPLPARPKTISLKEPRKRASYTMDERFWRWACMGVIRNNGRARTVRFRVPYRELFDHLVLSAALDGRYKGSGEIIIKRKEGLTLWLTTQNNLLKS